MKRKQRPPLLNQYSEDTVNIGVDEAGRGPLFGRVYVSAVMLPLDFDVSKVKDSKLFSSKKQIKLAAEYIKTHAIAYAIEYEDEKVIDELNILHATQKAMRRAISKVMETIGQPSNLLLLIDGSYFTPMEGVKHVTIEKGDGKYASIASASILAKVARDEYMLQMCEEFPHLKTQYGLHTNMGYGTKKHMDGLTAYGPTQWHRMSFRPCSIIRPN